MSYILDQHGNVIGHILRTPGYYSAQVRRFGCRNWRIVGRCKSRARAISKAALSMQSDDHRLRVVFVPTGETGSYYEPNLDFEGKRA